MQERGAKINLEYLNPFQGSCIKPSEEKIVPAYSAGRYPGNKQERGASGKWGSRESVGGSRSFKGV